MPLCFPYLWVLPGSSLKHHKGKNCTSCGPAPGKLLLLLAPDLLCNSTGSNITPPLESVLPTAKEWNRANNLQQVIYVMNLPFSPELNMHEWVLMSSSAFPVWRGLPHFFPLCIAFNATYQSQALPGASKSWYLLFKWCEVVTVYISFEKLFLILKWKSIQIPLSCAAHSPLKYGFNVYRCALAIHFSWEFVLGDLGYLNVCTKGSVKATNNKLVQHSLKFCIC